MQTGTQKKEILKEILRYFLRLGLTGFGGPLAFVAQMERDLSDRWIPKAQFAQAFAAIKTLPGPVAFQTAVFMGYQRGLVVDSPLLGATIAGAAVVLPAAVMMVIIASTRSAWSNWSWTHSFIIGLQAAALGLIAASAIPLAKSAAAKDRAQRVAKWMFAAFGFVLTLTNPSFEPAAIILSGLMCLAPFRTRLFAVHPTPVVLVAATAGLSAWEIHSSLLLTCLKAGGLVFGSGLAIVPILGAEFVDRLQWLTHSEFLEALMFGQITPGPIVITATYIGSRVAGISGALTATIGIFILPFIHMTTWFPRFWARVSSNHQWSRFSFGAISCVIGAVIASVIKLAEPAVLTALEIEPRIDKTLVSFTLWLVLAPLSFYVSMKRKAPAWAVVLGGGFIAWLALFFVR